MSIADKKLEAITEQDLLDLIDEQIREGRSIDYKLGLYGSGDPAKQEFRLDVASFANTSGGDLVIGMDERDAFPKKLVGVALPAPDNETRRMFSFLENRVWPRISGVQVWPIKLASGLYAVIVRVPPSWYGPHLVDIGDLTFRFPVRNGTGKSYMDGLDVRRAIENSQSRTERLRSFRRERVARIVAGNSIVEPANTPFNLDSEEAKLVFHIIPLAALDGTNLDLSRLQNSNSYPLPIRRLHFSSRFNFDGFVSEGWIRQATKDAPQPSGYAQVYRSGILEIVDNALFGSWANQGMRATYEDKLLEAIPDWITSLKNLGVSAPVAIGLSLVNVRGWRLLPVNVDPREIEKTGHANPQPHLIVPEVVIDSLEFEPAVELRPVFEIVWNAFGYARAESYDENGTRKITNS